MELHLSCTKPIDVFYVELPAVNDIQSENIVIGFVLVTIIGLCFPRAFVLTGNQEEHINVVII